jgi:hypothetical protein
MKKIVLGFCILFFMSSINMLKAQSNLAILNSPKKVDEKPKKPYAQPGTYQFLYHSSKVKYVFTNEILIRIEENRDEKIVKKLWLTPTVEVMILPKIYIESADFIPLPERKNVDD